jgi:cyclopropane fatty-acyl-phospholipid synthase-like methyltransferase
MSMDTVPRDRWAAWLLSRRQGGAEQPSEDVLEWLRAVRDRVLAGAQLQPDEVVLDVGCGDGLIGFGALELLSEQGRVIFSDVSRDLLDHCQTIADALGVSSRCRLGASERAPMMDFDERDLVAIAESAGFGDIHLTYEVEIAPRPPQDWERYLNSSGNPLSPTLDEALRHALTPAERDSFIACMRPLVEQGHGILRRAKAFLSARRVG